MKNMKIVTPNIESLFSFFYAFRYYDPPQDISQDQLSQKDLWSDYAISVDKACEESSSWIQQNVHEHVDHHKILAGWCLSLSQRFLMVYTKVVAAYMIKWSSPTFAELLEKIGLDGNHERVFDQCVSHQLPAGDLNGKVGFKTCRYVSCFGLQSDDVKSSNVIYRHDKKFPSYNYVLHWKRLGFENSYELV